MKKCCQYIYLYIICVISMAFLCSCRNNIYAGNITWGNDNTLPTSPEILDYDFQADGLVVQTEQYGKCSIQVASTNESAVVFVSGKNLCGGVAGTALPKTINGITYSESEDGSIAVSGTATKNSVCYIAGALGESTTNADRIFLQEGTYTFSGCPEGGSSSTYRLRLIIVKESGEKLYYNDTGNGVTFTLVEAAYAATCIQVIDGTTIDNLRFAPQLEIGNQATEYEAYRGEKYTVEVTDGFGTLDVTLSDAADMQFYTFRSNGSSLTVSGFGTMVNSVKPIWHASQPHFAIIDDDGKDDVYTVLMPLLNERGIKFSTSVIPAKLNTSGCLTTDQLREIVEAGNKVMCHSKSHKNLVKVATTYEERYDEIIGGKHMLADLGFDVDTMVYPNGSYDDEVLAITRRDYKYGISTSGETAY